MDVTKSNQTSSYYPKSSTSESHVADAASDLLKESKKMANGLYEDGKHKISDVQESIKGYSDEIVQKVHTKPITSLLIAAGIGFILSAFLRR